MSSTPSPPARPTPGTAVSALDIARALGMFPPTDEQQAVIEAPLTPTLVVAGAGSGKTETMANRVLWLLANSHARPDQILGLTFTRKAAGELAERVNGRIRQLGEAGLMPATDPAADPVTGLAAPSGPDSADLFNAPAVSTYNSFASRLFTDNALLLGREPESVLLSETSAWLLARRVVVAAGDGRLVRYGKSVDAVTDAVLSLSRALAENPPPFVPGEEPVPHDLARLAQSFGYLADLPYGNPRKRKPYDSVLEAIGAVAPLPVLAELADAYQAEKRRQGLIEFSDQVALALQVCRKVPAVVARNREQYRIVLLDEYQDTSVLQTELLRTLFAHHPVMAVGDPHQSIYGWRGASSANLLGFSTDFADLPNTRAPSMSLSFTWRNPVAVLDTANALVAPLSAQLKARPNGIQVETLKVPQGKAAGRVQAAMHESLADEAAAIARWFAERLAPGDPDAEPESGAMLFRARRDMEFYAEVLREHGVPAHVLGLGGLLSTPEVADVLAVLRVVHDPAAGSDLIRLLTGGRWRIGVRDLQVLANVAGWLASHDWAQKAVSDELKAKLRASVATEENRSLVDALDFVATAPDTHGQLADFSDEGRRRLRQAGRQLGWLRSRLNLGLLDLVRLIEQETLLDLELVANESHGRALANLYAFHDAVSAFLDSDELGTLASFLRWLDRAERQDDLGPRGEAAEPGTVQLLTVHGSKGLEWDYVAIPGLTEKNVPAPSKEVAGWLRFGELPYPCRGDRAELPELRRLGHETQMSFDIDYELYKEELADRHDAEERRLIYVATTRAQQQLLLTGAFWGAGTTVRKPSRYLLELAEAGLINELPEGSEHPEKPVTAGDATEVWPFDPLGSRRPVVEAAAALVRTHEGHRTAAGDEPGADADDGTGAVRPAETPWSREVTLLLAERAQRLTGPGTLELPTRIPASRFKDYVDDPQAVLATLRRPMPERPYRATRLGTLFHSWVEQRSTGAASGDLLDAGLDELDLDLDLDSDTDADTEPAFGAAGDAMPLELEQLRRFQATFERSPWANLAPEDVEIEIHHVLGDQVFICKLDAVYRTETGYQVVDWKTGKAPKDAADLELKQTQLALYRLAYARWKGIDPATVDAVFYFVAEDRIVSPERLYSEEDLVRAWASVAASSAAPAAASEPTVPTGPVASSG